MILSSLRNWLVVLAALLLPGQASFLQAQRLDSFEGGAPRWRLVESDCGAQLAGQEISPILPHRGRSSELFELTCSAGEMALMAYPIEPCSVLNEFQPSIWCRCASSQIRLGVRVVFPKAMHPVSHSRLTTIIWGDTYRQPGNWERLFVKQIGDRLQQEIIGIRKQLDSQLDLDQPYIDALVINAYTGPGQVRVQLDDLDIGTMIPLASIGVLLPSNWRDTWSWRDDTQVQFNTGKQLPIWVENRGEQPAWLSSLGFNGLLLSQLPSPAQLDQIYDAGMSVISPPPVHLVEFDEKKLAAVKGWLIGVALNRDQAELARQQAAHAERLPQGLRRPLFGEALEHFWLFGRIANEVIVPAADPISAGEPLAKRAWLTKNLETAKHRGEGWVSIFVGANPALLDQYNTAVERLQGRAPAPPANPLGLRHEVIGALMSGAKGIVYRTQSPLLDPIAQQTNEDRAIQAAIRWTNSDLRTWTPWINFGQQVPPPQIDRTDFTSASWRVRDADLIILQNVAAHSQQCLPGSRNGPLTLSQTGRQEPHEVVRLTEGRMELMRVDRSPGMESWQLTNPNATEIFVVTGNPQVLQYLRQRISRQATENASDQLEIANYNLEQASELIEARFQLRSSSGSAEELRQRFSQQQRLVSIQQMLERGWQALQARQPENATSLAMQSIDRTQAILYESYLVAISNLAVPQSSPLVLMPATLKYHWLMADACQRSTWQPLELPGSQFVDLDEMLQSGWSQQRRLEEQVDLRVELVPPSNQVAQSLRLAAYPKSMSASGKTFEPIPGGYEGASLRVRSSGAPVRRGQLIRATATAHILHAGNDPASGLLVYDNQAWTSLGQLVRGKAGEKIPIELYRFVNQDGEFRLLAECRGTCDIQLESVNISVIEPATDRSSYGTLPLQIEFSRPGEQPANSANSDSSVGSSMQR